MKGSQMYIKREIEEFYNLHFLIKYLLGHNGFISGGCFKNIFTGNKIKDLDMFFRDEKDYVQTKICLLRMHITTFIMKMAKYMQ